MNTKLVLFILSFISTAHLQDNLMGILESNLHCFHKFNFNVYYITNNILSSLHINKNFTEAPRVQMLINMLHFQASTLLPRDCKVFEELRNVSAVKINETDNLKNILQNIVTEELENLKNNNTKLNIAKSIVSNKLNKIEVKSSDNTFEYNNNETNEDYMEYWSMANEILRDRNEKAELLNKLQNKLRENSTSKLTTSRKKSDAIIRFDTRRVKRIKRRHKKKKKKKSAETTSQENDEERFAVCPFLVSIHLEKEFMCYGSIISEDTVITAASCLQIAYNNKRYQNHPKHLFVRIVDHFTKFFGVLIPIVQVKFYPFFESDTLKHNLAIVTMQHCYSNTSKVEEIKYDKKDDDFPVEVKDVTVLGWIDKDVTDISSSVQGFAIADMRIYDIDECLAMYPRSYISEENNFCAWYMSRTNGACLGDVGGPAVVNGELVGIISFGPNICGIADSPTVFTKIGYYADWIDQVISIKQDFSVKNYKNKTS